MLSSCHCGISCFRVWSTASLWLKRRLPSITTKLLTYSYSIGGIISWKHTTHDDLWKTAHVSTRTILAQPFKIKWNDFHQNLQRIHNQRKLLEWAIIIQLQYRNHHKWFMLSQPDWFQHLQRQSFWGNLRHYASANDGATQDSTPTRTAQDSQVQANR